MPGGFGSDFDELFHLTVDGEPRAPERKRASRFPAWTAWAQKLLAN